MLASFSWIVNLTETRIELKPHNLKPHLWHYSVLSFKEKQQQTNNKNNLLNIQYVISWHVWNPKMSVLKALLSFLLHELVLTVFKPITRHHLTSLKNNILLSARTRVSPEGPVSWKFQKGVLYVCCVCRQDQRFHNFEKDTICLSVLEAKLTGLWARNYGTMQQVLILKFAFGPEKLPGLSRNRPLDGDKYRSFIGA